MISAIDYLLGIAMNMSRNCLKREPLQLLHKKGLTPELTGARGPIGPQGTNIGHENGEAMANVGVRVERFVRLVINANHVG
jgi:hypothetical protein